jgi:hypothetical protein
MTETLSTQIRTLVDDGSPSIDITELLARSRQPRGRRSRAPVVVALAAILVLVTVAVTALLASTSNDNEHVHRTETNTSAQRGLTDDCRVVEQTDRGCPRTLEEASGILGFHALAPTRLPEGWVRERSMIKAYVPNNPPLNPEPDVIVVYNQVWTPPGVNLTTDSDAPYLQIVQRIAAPHEDSQCREAPTTLINGAPVCKNDLVQDRPSRTWTKNGVWYWALAVGLPATTMDDVVNSMR